MQNVFEIFIRFLKLGCMAFGGPTAHFGFFRAEFVEKRKWLDDALFADLMALCQFLPGPASSQQGIAIGWVRGGWLGGFAAWLGFTLPTACLMIAVAIGIHLFDSELSSGWLEGLQIAVVAVVANALGQMIPKLCPDRIRFTIMVIAAIAVAIVSGIWTQLAVILGGAVVGILVLSKDDATPALGAQPTRPVSALGTLPVFLLFLTLLLISIFFPVNQADPLIAASAKMYETGSLVFGGGHVVLPLLRDAVVTPGWVPEQTFLGGYGAAQSMPGPLFGFSAFVGASIDGFLPPVIGGFLLVAAIYLPSFLLLFCALPHWQKLRNVALLRRALSGVNAAVVGLLLAAFYNPVWVSGVTDALHAACALAAWWALRGWKVPPWAVVIVSAGVGAVIW